nr:PREDICTED: probable trehalose-phosphate phosphatase F [Daucus carota subsp. sativus]
MKSSSPPRKKTPKDPFAEFQLKFSQPFSPIVDHDPDRAFMSGDMHSAAKNAGKHFPTAIISGRRRDMVGILELLYAGSHGMDIRYLLRDTYTGSDGMDIRYLLRDTYTGSDGWYHRTSRSQWFVYRTGKFTIVAELVANPSLIIFMGEPTSGLDAIAAVVAMRTL